MMISVFRSMSILFRYIFYIIFYTILSCRSYPLPTLKYPYLHIRILLLLALVVASVYLISILYYAFIICGEHNEFIAFSYEYEQQYWIYKLKKKTLFHIISWKKNPYLIPTPPCIHPCIQSQYDFSTHIVPIYIIFLCTKQNKHVAYLLYLCEL